MNNFDLKEFRVNYAKMTQNELAEKINVSQDRISRWESNPDSISISDYAKMLENNEMLSYCNVVVGKNTDPDGHELVVIIPYERRSKIKDIAEMLDKTVYSSVEALI